MATFHFDLVSPDKLVYSGEVDQVDVPGTEGDFGVLAGHAPYVAVLKPGILVVHQGGQKNRIVVTGGFAEVNPQGLTILADNASTFETFDNAQLAAEIKDTEEDFSDAPEGHTKDRLADRLQQLRALQAALGTAATAH
jgi:F-type H+-transporting ATPase subunit epsilon